MAGYAIRLRKESGIKEKYYPNFIQELAAAKIAYLRDNKYLTNLTDSNFKAAIRYAEKHRERINTGKQLAPEEVVQQTNEEQMRVFNSVIRKELDLLNGTIVGIERLIGNKISDPTMRNQVISLVQGIMTTSISVGIESERHGVSGIIQKNMYEGFGVKY